MPAHELSLKNPKELHKMGMRWLCSQCLLTPLNVTTSKLNKSSEPTIATLQEMILKLQDRIDVLEKQCPGNMPSRHTSKIDVKPFANDKVRPKVSHQVLLKSQDNEVLTQQSFADKVKKNLQAIPINSIKVSKQGVGVITFPNESTRDDGYSKLKDKFCVESNNRPYRSLLPKITISNIQTSDYNNTDASKLSLVKAICDKNSDLKLLIDAGKVFDVILIKEDSRNIGASFAVARVDKEIYSKIQALHYQIFIDFNRCRVTDRFHVTQCYGCQKFGHVRSKCPTKHILVCRYCSGEHDGKNCPVKGDFKKYNCSNCHANHSTTYAGCPVLKNQALSLMQRTQGLEAHSKNDLRPYVITT